MAEARKTTARKTRSTSETGKLAELLEQVAEERKRLQRILSTADTAARSVRTVSAAITEAVRKTSEMAATLAKLEKGQFPDNAETGLRQVKNSVTGLEQAINSVRQIRIDLGSTDAAIKATVRRAVAKSADTAVEQLDSLNKEAALARKSAKRELKRMGELGEVVMQLEQKISELDKRTDAIGKQAQRGEAVAETLEEAEASAERVESQITRLQDRTAELDELETLVRRLTGTAAAFREDMDRLESMKSDLHKTRALHGETLASVTKADASIHGLERRMSSLLATAPRVEQLKDDAQRVETAAREMVSRSSLLDQMEVRITGLEVRGDALAGEMEELDKRKILLEEFGKRTDAVEGRLDSADEHLANVEKKVDDIDRVEERATFAIDWLQETSDRIRRLREDLSSAIEREGQLASVAEYVENLSGDIEQRETRLKELLGELERANSIREQASEAAAALEEKDRALRSSLAEGEETMIHLQEFLDGLHEREQSVTEIQTQFSDFDDRIFELSGAEKRLMEQVEGLLAREKGVAAVRDDLARAFETAEKTLAKVRAISQTQEDIVGSRAATDRVLQQALAVDEVARRIESRKPELDAIEKRIERLETVLSKVHGVLGRLSEGDGDAAILRLLKG